MADFTALRGIVCPVVSPCTSNEGVEYDSLQENLARLLRAPITGFYVCGGTGDGSRLTFAERCRTAELTIAQTRAAGRRTIVHVGQTLQRHALELAEHAMTLGADAVAAGRLERNGCVLHRAGRAGAGLHLLHSRSDARFGRL